MPARMPIDFTELILNRNMIIDRNSQSVPVIRNTHHQLPARSSKTCSCSMAIAAT